MMNKNIICPYCYHNFNNSMEYFHEGLDGDGDEDIIDCTACDKKFKIVLHVEYYYSSEKNE